MRLITNESAIELDDLSQIPGQTFDAYPEISSIRNRMAMLNKWLNAFEELFQRGGFKGPIIPRSAIEERI